MSSFDDKANHTGTSDERANGDGEERNNEHGSYPRYEPVEADTDERATVGRAAGTTNDAAGHKLSKESKRPERQRTERCDYQSCDDDATGHLAPNFFVIIAVMQNTSRCRITPTANSEIPLSPQ